MSDAQVCERRGCGHLVTAPPNGGRAARFCSASCRAAWHRAKARADQPADDDLGAVAGQLTAALAAASRAAAALVAAAELTRPGHLEELRGDLELALLDRDSARAAMQAVQRQLEVVSGEAQALRDALHAERQLRILLHGDSASGGPSSVAEDS
ncbi:MAG: hypothetical protein DLM61_07340 [Pseudonocardiales bacterium]|nr:MAG: hypothetical protein DLM61_07340 [Pseudonocardiales bacterium]